MSDDFKSKGYKSKSEMKRIETIKESEKPKEFWIDANLEAYNKPEHSLFKNLIHVIEYSAYEKAKLEEERFYKLSLSNLDSANEWREKFEASTKEVLFLKAERDTYRTKHDLYNHLVKGFKELDDRCIQLRAENEELQDKVYHATRAVANAEYELYLLKYPEVLNSVNEGIKQAKEKKFVKSPEKKKKK